MVSLIIIKAAIEKVKDKRVAVPILFLTSDEPSYITGQAI